MKKIRAFICFLGCFFKNAGQKNCTKIFQPFSNISFFKQIKNWGGRFFEKPSTPIFFYLLILHRGGCEENLKKIFGMALSRMDCTYFTQWNFTKIVE